MSRREHSFLSIPLKSQMLIHLEIWEEWEEMELYLINFVLKLLKYPYILNPLF